MNPIEFLQWRHPDRTWLLSAATPDKKDFTTKAFPPGPNQAADAAEWIDERNGKQNIWYSLAEPIEIEDKKAGIGNVKTVFELHIDWDAGKPPEDCDAAAWIAQQKEAKLIELREVKPSLIVDSGGGLHAYWDLDEPVHVEGSEAIAKEIASLNKALEQRLNADSCSNVDRILRLPGTWNIPDKRKAAKGRTKLKAEVVFMSGETHLITDFARWTEDEIPDAPIAQLGSIDDLDQWLAKRWGSQKANEIKVICVQGIDPDEPDKHPSRSEWLFDATCQMVRADVPDSVILGVLMDPGFKISASVLESPDPERYARRQVERAKDAAVSERLCELNERHAVISNFGGRCIVMEEVFDEALDRHRLTTQSFTDFRNRYMNTKEEYTDADGNVKTTPVGQWWLDHPKRRQYHTITFAPGEGDLPHAYNLWQGFAFQEVPGTAHTSMLRHLAHTICREPVPDSELESPNRARWPRYHYLLGWCAKAVQSPNEPGITAIVMRGPQGTGKSFFAKHFGKLFGRHFLHVSSAAHLVGQFNGHLRDSVVVFGDEAFYQGNKQHESTLKTLITEQTLMVERKGIDAEPVPNFTHVILATNSEWAVRIPGDDRRFFTVDIDDRYQRDEEHFGTIARDLRNGGYESWLHMLKRYDLEDWRVQSLPTLAEKDESIALNPLEIVIRDALDDGIYPWCMDRRGYFISRHLADYLRDVVRWDSPDISGDVGRMLRSLKWPKITGAHSLNRWAWPKEKAQVVELREAFSKTTGWRGVWEGDGVYVQEPDEGGPVDMRGMSSGHRS